jgi:hypothetical protein
MLKKDIKKLLKSFTKIEWKNKQLTLYKKNGEPFELSEFIKNSETYVLIDTLEEYLFDSPLTNCTIVIEK